MKMFRGNIRTEGLSVGNKASIPKYPSVKN